MTETTSKFSAVFAEAGDASSTRTVYMTIVALVVIGVLLLVVAIWLFKQTKPEPELLAPLERMDDRSWRRQNPTEARRDLDGLRPSGARPVAKAQGVPSIDSQFSANSPVLGSFDDLDSDFAVDGSGDLRSGAPRLSDADQGPPPVGTDPLLRFDADPDAFPSPGGTGAFERPSTLSTDSDDGATDDANDDVRTGSHDH